MAQKLKNVDVESTIYTEQDLQHYLSGHVPTSRKVAGKELTADIDASDISSAISNDFVQPDALNGYALSSHKHDDRYYQQNQLIKFKYTDLESNSVDVQSADDTKQNAIVFCANDDSQFGALHNIVGQNYVETILKARRKIDGEEKTSFIDLAIADDGAMTAKLSFDPLSSSNDRQIATTRWVNGKNFATQQSLAGYSLTSHTHNNYVPTTRQIAGLQLSSDINADNLKSALSVPTNYVPNTRTIADQSLANNITKSVLAGALGLNQYSLTSHTHNNYVPTTRQIAGLQLTGDITKAALTTALGVPTDSVPTSRRIADLSLTGDITKAALTTALGVPTDSVPTSRKVAGKALTADIAASDLKLALDVPTDYVPNTRKIANKELTADITTEQLSNAIGLNNYYKKDTNVAIKTDLPTNASTTLKDIHRSFTIQANNGNVLGGLECSILSSDSQRVYTKLLSRRTTSTGEKTATIYTEVSGDALGAKLNFNPLSSSNNTQIATTKWVNDCISAKNFISEQQLKAMGFVTDTQSWDSALAQIFSILDEHDLSIYVDAVNGNDENGGKDAEHPVKTFNAAMKLANSRRFKQGTKCYIFLMSDYHITPASTNAFNASQVISFKHTDLTNEDTCFVLSSYSSTRHTIYVDVKNNSNGITITKLYLTPIEMRAFVRISNVDFYLTYKDETDDKLSFDLVEEQKHLSSQISYILSESLRIPGICTKSGGYYDIIGNVKISNFRYGCLGSGRIRSIKSSETEFENVYTCVTIEYGDVQFSDAKIKCSHLINNIVDFSTGNNFIISYNTTIDADCVYGLAFRCDTGGNIKINGSNAASTLTNTNKLDITYANRNIISVDSNYDDRRRDYVRQNVINYKCNSTEIDQPFTINSNGDVNVRTKFENAAVGSDFKMTCVKRIINLLCGSDKSIIYTESSNTINHQSIKTGPCSIIIGISDVECTGIWLNLRDPLP